MIIMFQPNQCTLILHAKISNGAKFKFEKVYQLQLTTVETLCRKILYTPN